MSKPEARILETVNPAPTEDVDDDAARPDESRADAFKRLANARVNKAIKMIALIGNLAGPQYESTTEQHDAIQRALVLQLDATMNKLRKVKTAAAKFEL